MGVVHIYDLSVNRNEKICYQKVVKRAKLTHVAFNNVEPIIIVGDDRGGVNTLKLSPNLRISVRRTEETDPNKSDWDLQIDKMEHLLEMVTETKELLGVDSPRAAALMKWSCCELWAATSALSPLVASPCPM